jgi:HlyD family secretion protein
MATALSKTGKQLPLDDFHHSLRRNTLAAVTMLAMLVGVCCAASFIEISGAVIAAGKVVVNSEVKKVQHSTGGVIGEILVVNGQTVSAGQVVARLDATAAKANLGIISKSLDDLIAKRNRLTAERDDLSEIVFERDLTDKRDSEDVRRVILTEEGAFLLRRRARDGEKAQLTERIEQLRQEISGLNIQSGATFDELSLVNTDLDGVRRLWGQKLVQYAKLNGLEREATKLKGTIGSLTATIAQTKARVAETELQVLQVDQDFRRDVAKEMSEVGASIAELEERRIAAQDQLNRIDIRAPQAGVVHQLSVHTIGGVVGSQETLMLIVPQSDLLVVDARVSPNDIDQIYLDQKVFLKFPSFNQKSTPERHGILERISPDLIIDAKTGQQYYEVRILLDGDETQFRLVPGMPADAFLQTGDRSILSYLVKPIADFFALAFRAT